MVIFQQDMTYKGLVELSVFLYTQLKYKCIHITMTLENSINGMSYEIQDDDDICCNIALLKEMTQLVPFLFDNYL